MADDEFKTKMDFDQTSGIPSYTCDNCGCELDNEAYEPHSFICNGCEEPIDLSNDGIYCDNDESHICQRCYDNAEDE